MTPWIALALQGDVEAHTDALACVGAGTVEVRKPVLDACDALVLPGGESTAVLRGIERRRFTRS